MPEIRVSNIGAAFPASQGTILDAALTAGVPFPHGCRAGNCGDCKCRIQDGQVDIGTHDPWALDANEKAEGIVLACRAEARTDVTLEWLNEANGIVYEVRKASGKVLEIERVTSNISKILVELPAGSPMFFAAGQYAELSFEGLPSRPYSMANRPGDRLLEFHIGHSTNGHVSSYVAQSLKVGETVHVKGPYGSAHLRDEHNGPMLAIAGGCGLGAMKSIVETALDRGCREPVHLYFGVRSESDVYYEDFFVQLSRTFPNFHFVPVLSEPSGQTLRRTGWVHAAIAADLPKLAGWKTYMAGPPKMVDAAKSMVADKGARPEDIHADPFIPACGHQDRGGLFLALRRVVGWR